MMRDFRLELHNRLGRSTFVLPGKIAGTIVVVVDEPKSYNAITVTLSGCANVRWSERRTTRTMQYHSHEDCINKRIVLWTKEQVPNRMLNPGQHTLPFTFAVSNRVPSSFEGSHGCIKYTVEARISTGLFRFDRKIDSEIQVVGEVDINVPQLLRPVQYEDEKTICCLFCASPPVSLTVNVPRTGFCIGEGIPLVASLDNGSNSVITIRATVVQTATFRVRRSTHTCTDTNRLISFESPPVGGRSSYRWVPAHQRNVIRSAIPTIANCGIVSLQYTLLIEAVIPWGINAAIHIPIVLGNVPLKSPTGQPPVSPPQYQGQYQGPPS